VVAGAVLLATSVHAFGWTQRAGCTDDSIDPGCPTFVQARFLRLVAGGGGLFLGSGGHGDVSIDFGFHPFAGAFSTGIWTSGAFAEHWLVVSGGIFMQLDLTYVAVSGLWSHNPRATWPFRVQVGGRLGLDGSRSVQPRPELPDPPPYQLMRPAVHAYVNIEVPLTDHAPRLAWVLRGTVDLSVNLLTAFRWNVSTGLSFGFDPLP
jgi:hypothetical protein